MKDLKTAYLELCNLSQLFLTRNYSPCSKKVVDKENLSFFQPKNSSDKPLDNPSKINTNSTRKEMPEAYWQSSTTTKVVISEENALPPSQNKSIPLKEVQSTPLKVASNQSSAVVPTKKEVILSEKHAKHFDLVPLGEFKPKNYRQFRQLLQKIMPVLALHEQIPSDKEAIEIKNCWRKLTAVAPVVLITFDESTDALSFLKNINKAILLNGHQAQVISAVTIKQIHGWENFISDPTLRLIIASSKQLRDEINLKHLFRKEGSDQYFLNAIPLILLDEIEHYFHRPQLKSLLWRAICNHLK